MLTLFLILVEVFCLANFGLAISPPMVAIMADTNNMTEVAGFFETYFDYKKEKFVLNNFFVVMENIDKNIAKTLNELLYHNLAKIKCIYKATLNVDLGDISVLAKAVEIRHDIIHRNCKHTDNTSFEITETQLDNLIKCVDTFITYIEEQIKLL